jgi:ketosteroid isomerase-like protein
MTDKARTNTILVFFTFLTFLISAGCKQQRMARSPLSADNIQALSSELGRLSIANIQAWINKDATLMRQIYTEEVVHHDANVELIKGLENMIQFTNIWKSYFPNYNARVGDTFIDKNDGVYLEESWGWTPECSSKDISSSNNPNINYSWLTLRDGKISYWWMFYGKDTCPAMIPSDSKLLQDYAGVWSSGKPQTIASLYAEDAIRQDSLFNENQEGNQAISEFAKNFINWYPGVRLTLLDEFAEGPKVIKRGGVYSIQISDPGGKPCEVKMLVVLEPDATQSKIAKEWVFYNADSLIACGWAQ